MEYPLDLSFLFTAPTRIVFGAGSASEIPVELAGLGRAGRCW